LSEEVTLAGNLKEHRSALLERHNSQLVSRHVTVKHDVATTEIGLDRANMHTADIAGLLLVALIRDERGGQRALQRRVYHQRPSLRLLNAAVLPNLLHEVEDVLGGQRRGANLVRLGDRATTILRHINAVRKRLQQATSAACGRVRRRLVVRARDERLLNVTRDLLKRLRKLPAKLILNRVATQNRGRADLVRRGLL